MRVSCNWLSRHVDLNGVDLDALGRRFTMAVAELDGIEKIGFDLAKVVVGHVNEVHGIDGKKVRLTRVDCGPHGVREIICGAPNVAVGQRVAVALPGQQLGAMEIAVAEVAGIVSYGMICSEKELGLSEDHGGIMTLNKVFAVNIDLEVPEGLVVSAFTDAGRVNIEGLLVHEIDTARGDVDLAFTGSLIDEEASIRTSDGRVTIDSHDGDLDILTTNAPLDLFSVAGNVRATTTQGPITARVLPPNRGEVILATTNAPIDLSVPRDFGAELIAVTSAPGAVFISGDLIFTPRRSFPDQAEGTLGNGAGRVDLRTIGADIAVHR